MGAQQQLARVCEQVQALAGVALPLAVAATASGRLAAQQGRGAAAPRQGGQDHPSAIPRPLELQQRFAQVRMHGSAAQTGMLVICRPALQCPRPCIYARQVSRLQMLPKRTGFAGAGRAGLAVGCHHWRQQQRGRCPRHHTRAAAAHWPGRQH